jgi:hypothetical protein
VTVAWIIEMFISESVQNCGRVELSSLRTVPFGHAVYVVCLVSSTHIRQYGSMEGAISYLQFGGGSDQGMSDPDSRDRLLHGIKTRVNSILHKRSRALRAGSHFAGCN